MYTEDERLILATYDFREGADGRWRAYNAAGSMVAMFRRRESCEYDVLALEGLR